MLERWIRMRGVTAALAFVACSVGSLASAQPVVTYTVNGLQQADTITMTIGGQTRVGVNAILADASVTTLILAPGTGVPRLDLRHDYRIRVPTGKTLLNGPGARVLLFGQPDPATSFRQNFVVMLESQATLDGFAVYADDDWEVIGAWDPPQPVGCVVQNCLIQTHKKGINFGNGLQCIARHNDILVLAPLVAPSSAGFAIRTAMGDQNRIEFNTIDGYAWLLRGVPDKDPSRPGCCIPSPPPDPLDPIAVYGGQDNLILRNTVRGCNAAGIYIFEFEGATTIRGVRNKVIENTVFDTLQYGIDCAGQNDPLVQGNIVRRTYAAGIMTAGINNGLIQGNDVAQADFLTSPVACVMPVVSCRNFNPHSAGILLREGTVNSTFISNRIAASPASWGFSFVIGPAGGTFPHGNIIGGPSPDHASVNVITLGAPPSTPNGHINAAPGNTILFNTLQ